MRQQAIGMPELSTDKSSIKTHLGSVTRWIEILTLAIGIPLLKWLFDLNDPFFTQASFPWLLIPLLLLALRYGTVTAAAGFGLLVVLTLAHIWSVSGKLPNATQWQNMAGMAIMLLLAGELTSQWRRRYTEGQEHLNTLRNSMHKVERELQVLQVSHAQLEEEMLGVGHSLKRSLDVVKKNVPKDASPTVQRAWLADKMMEVLGTYDWLETAAFLVVNANGVSNAQILAQKGNVQALSKEDYLLQEVMRSRRPVSFKREAYVDNSSNSVGSALIAALPVLDASGHLRMILAVQHIQFAAYNRKNLNLLATLCSWLGTLLPSHALMESRPDANWLPGAFAVSDEIHTALSLLGQHKRSVALLSVSIPTHERTKEYIQYFTSLTNGSNSLWQVPQGNKTLLIMLLPLSNPERIPLYEQGIGRNFQQRFGCALPQAGIRLLLQHVHQYQHKQQLVEYLKGVK